jgi:hypothetical protein
MVAVQDEGREITPGIGRGAGVGPLVWPVGAGDAFEEVGAEQTGGFGGKGAGLVQDAGGTFVGGAGPLP